MCTRPRRWKRRPRWWMCSRCRRFWRGRRICFWHVRRPAAPSTSKKASSCRRRRWAMRWRKFAGSARRWRTCERDGAMKSTREKPAKLSHVDEGGRAQMVDVSAKPVSLREAVAEGFISLAPATLRAIAEGKVPKGEVLAVARVAGIMAAKKCGELIPLCHPLAVESVTVDFDLPMLDLDEGERVTPCSKAVARMPA